MTTSTPTDSKMIQDMQAACLESARIFTQRSKELSPSVTEEERILALQAMFLRVMQSGMHIGAMLVVSECVEACAGKTSAKECILAIDELAQSYQETMKQAARSRAQEGTETS